MKQAIARILWSAVVTFFCIGCASTVDRGSLSNAVDKANDNNKGDRTVVGTAPTDDTSSSFSSCLFGSINDEDDGDAASPGYLDAAPPEGMDATPLLAIFGPNYFGARILTSNRLSSNYTNSVGGGLLWVNHYKKKRAFEVALQTEVITTGEKSRLFGSINRIVDFELGLHTRRYSTPDYTLMGLYLKYGCDLNFLSWKYKNPVTSVVKDEQGNELTKEKIEFDGLFGINGDIGVGWSFVQMKRAKISFELLIGGTLFWFKTFEAFKNDMFMPDGFIKADVEVLFGKGER